MLQRCHRAVGLEMRAAAGLAVGANWLLRQKLPGSRTAQGEGEWWKGGGRVNVFVACIQHNAAPA